MLCSFEKKKLKPSAARNASQNNDKATLLRVCWSTNTRLETVHNCTSLHKRPDLSFKGCKDGKMGPWRSLDKFEIVNSPPLDRDFLLQKAIWR